MVGVLNGVNTMKRYIKLFCLLILIYFILMTGVYLIPDSWIQNNMNNAIEYIENKEGRYSNFYYVMVGATTDSWTDISELGKTLLNDGEKNLIERAMDNGSYARYWHGNHVIMRIMFIFMSYLQIRYISQFIVIGAISFAFAMVWRKGGIGIGSIFLASIIPTFPFTISLNFQYMIPFLVMLFGVIYMCAKRYNDTNMGCFFFVIGSLINFLDLLTFPLVTLLMPLILDMVLRIRHKKYTGFENFIISMKYSLIWVSGYALTWVSKWVLATMILRKNICLDAINSVMYRSGNDGEGNKIGRLEAVKRCAGVYFMTMPKLTYFVILLTILILMIYSLKYHRNFKRTILQTWSLMPLALFPVFWIFILANHSYLHFSFVYRIYMGSLFAVGCFCVEYVRVIREAAEEYSEQ